MESTLAKHIPAGYVSYWNCSKLKKGYSGTAVLSKVEPISVEFDFGKAGAHDTEGRTITLEFEAFYLVCVYVPNAGEGLKRLDYRVQEWDRDFQQYVQQLKKPVIVCGDFNVAHNEIDVYDTKGKEKVPGFTPQER